MKVLFVSTTDKMGGAAIAVNRIHQGLRKLGLDVKMFVQLKLGKQKSVIGLHSPLYQKAFTAVKLFLDRSFFFFLKKEPKMVYSANLINYSIAKKINAQKADIVQLCWVGAGFVPIAQIPRIHAPLVWRLSDMWPFLHGPHYFEDICSTKKSAVAKRIMKEKKKAFAQKDITVVAISRWLANEAKKSELFTNARIEVINNAIDTDTWKPVSKKLAREELGFDMQKKIILFGADNATADKRKGFSYLKKALKLVSESNMKDKVHVIVFGSKDSLPEVTFCGMAHTVFGKISPPEKLISLYSVADCMVVPSLQEAFGQTALEALSCATPVVVFENTGLVDMMHHKKNGYVSKFADEVDLAQGILWCLENNSQEVRNFCRKGAVANFSDTVIAKKYKQLYEELSHV